MKRKVLSILLVCCMAFGLLACGKKAADPAPTSEPAAETKTETPAIDTTKAEDAEPVVGTEDVDEMSALTGGQLVDGKFAETRHITVEVYDRGNDGGTDPTNNMYIDFIKKGMLEKYNVEVEFVAVPRWTEVEQINNLLAAGDAPDVCLTYDYATILAYANMGGVLDLSEYTTDEYKPLFPNLWNWLGAANINCDKDPQTGTIWAIEGKRNNTYRINTFVRQDWLTKLNMQAPKTTEEFEAMLVAFKDNAETLLGADADKMVPLSVGSDVGWRAANIIESFMDPNITDKELYVNGFDDRKFTENGTKEAIRLLNKWYNAGLMWKDFALYSNGDSTEDDMMKAGYVGAFIHNYDYPFRNGEDSINANLNRAYGADANFVAVNCFQDKNGKYSKYSYSAAGDRKIFFPYTNDEPLASMLYLDFISDQANIQYLQIGDEGVTHEVLADGAIKTVAAEAPAIMNSGNNIDMTITCNGLRLATPELTNKSLAYGYAECDPQIVADAMAAAALDAIAPKSVNVGAINSEEGMGTALSEKRDIVFDNAVIASEADFDSVWDNGMADYLAAGGQAIMDERLEKWNANFSGDMLPE